MSFSIGIKRWFELLFVPCIMMAACKSSGSAQQPAAGGEYEVINRAHSQKQDSLLAEKYATKLGVEQQKVIKSIVLYKFLDRNLNTPCSKTPGENTTTDTKFAQQLYKQVYNRKIPGTYTSLKHSNLVPKFSSRDYLTEGDMLFFEQHPPNPDDFAPGQLSNSTDEVIGVYLRNNRFVTCSEKDGAVAIDNIKLPYWDSRYKMAGRLR